MISWEWNPVHEEMDNSNPLNLLCTHGILTFKWLRFIWDWLLIIFKLKNKCNWGIRDKQFSRLPFDVLSRDHLPHHPPIDSHHPASVPSPPILHLQEPLKSLRPASVSSPTTVLCRCASSTPHCSTPSPSRHRVVTGLLGGFGHGFEDVGFGIGRVGWIFPLHPCSLHRRKQPWLNLMEAMVSPSTRWRQRRGPGGGEVQ